MSASHTGKVANITMPSGAPTRCKTAQHEKPPPGMFAAPNVLEMTEVVQSSYSPHAFLDAWRNEFSESDEVA